MRPGTSLKERSGADALRTYGSCREAARRLGVDHSTVVKKLARYGIPR